MSFTSVQDGASALMDRPRSHAAGLEVQRWGEVIGQNPNNRMPGDNKLRYGRARGYSILCWYGDEEMTGQTSRPLSIIV